MKIYRYGYIFGPFFLPVDPAGFMNSLDDERESALSILMERTEFVGYLLVIKNLTTHVFARRKVSYVRSNEKKAYKQLTIPR